LGITMSELEVKEFTWHVIAPDGSVEPLATVRETKAKEPDTYTYIPNQDPRCGGSVRHDQSGWTVGYRRYQEYDKDVINTDYLKEAFATWMTWNSTKRGQWRKQQEAKKPMAYVSYFDECVPFSAEAPVKEAAKTKKSGSFPKKEPPYVMSEAAKNNSYIRYVEDPSFPWWTIEKLQEELEATIAYLEDLINVMDEDEYENAYEDRKLLEEAILYFNLKGNNTMNTANATVIATADTTTRDQREYLLTRLRNMDYEKELDLQAHFKLNPVKGPKTLKDLIAKIKDGDFEFDTDFYSEDTEFYSTSELVSSMRWTKEKSDRKGYDAAMKAKNTAYTKTVDIIKIKSPEEGLKALEVFESQTFH
jgi:hypothetical protein